MKFENKKNFKNIANHQHYNCETRRLLCKIFGKIQKKIKIAKKILEKKLEDSKFFF